MTAKYPHLYGLMKPTDLPEIDPVEQDVAEGELMLLLPRDLNVDLYDEGSNDEK